MGVKIRVVTRGRANDSSGRGGRRGVSFLTVVLLLTVGCVLSRLLLASRAPSSSSSVSKTTVSLASPFGILIVQVGDSEIWGFCVGPSSVSKTTVSLASPVSKPAAPSSPSGMEEAILERLATLEAGSVESASKPAAPSSSSGPGAQRSLSADSSSSGPGAQRILSADLGDPAAVAALRADRIGGTNLGPTRIEGSATATVMGMASGYPLKVYRSFVGTLRKSGFEGSIILAISADPLPGVVEYLASKNVTTMPLKLVNCTFDPDGGERSEATGHKVEMSTCAHPYSDIKVRWSRFPLLRDYLEGCDACTGPVLVCDVRDTLFQRDPFGVGAPEVEGLQVFQEHKSQLTAHWITQVPLEKCTGLDFAKPPYVSPMLCSGTTIGTRRAMLDYLGAMHGEMKLWMADPNCCCNKMNGDDQSIHNYLFYTGRLPYARAIHNRMGIVNTAGVQGTQVLAAHAKHLQKAAGMAKPLAMKVPYHGAYGNDRWIGLEFDLVDDEGFFTDYDGGRSRVVHQFDRFGKPMDSYLNDHKGKLWELLNNHVG